MGCCGAVGENPCVLKTYGGILLIIFISTMVSGIMAFVFKGEIQDLVNEAAKSGIEKWQCDPVTLEVLILKLIRL